MQHVSSMKEELRVANQQILQLNSIAGSLRAALRNAADRGLVEQSSVDGLFASFQHIKIPSQEVQMALGSGADGLQDTDTVDSARSSTFSEHYHAHANMHNAGRGAGLLQSSSASSSSAMLSSTTESTVNRRSAQREGSSKRPRSPELPPARRTTVLDVTMESANVPSSTVNDLGASCTSIHDRLESEAPPSKLSRTELGRSPSQPSTHRTSSTEGSSVSKMPSQDPSSEARADAEQLLALSMGMAADKPGPSNSNAGTGPGDTNQGQGQIQGLEVGGCNVGHPATNAPPSTGMSCLASVASDALAGPWEAAEPSVSSSASSSTLKLVPNYLPAAQGASSVSAGKEASRHATDTDNKFNGKVCNRLVSLAILAPRKGVPGLADVAVLRESQAYGGDGGSNRQQMQGSVGPGARDAFGGQAAGARVGGRRVIRLYRGNLLRFHLQQQEADAQAEACSSADEDGDDDEVKALQSKPTPGNVSPRAASKRTRRRMTSGSGSGSGTGTGTGARGRMQSSTNSSAFEDNDHVGALDGRESGFEQLSDGTMGLLSGLAQPVHSSWERAKAVARKRALDMFGSDGVDVDLVVQHWVHCTAEGSSLADAESVVQQQVRAEGEAGLEALSQMSGNGQLGSSTPGVDGDDQAGVQLLSQACKSREQRARAALHASRQQEVNSRKPVKGKLQAWERSLVTAFMDSVASGAIHVARGELARDVRAAINMARPKEFFEKLVSRRQMNQRLGGFLRPRRMRTELHVTKMRTTVKRGQKHGASTGSPSSSGSTPTARVSALDETAWRNARAMPRSMPSGDPVHVSRQHPPQLHWSQGMGSTGASFTLCARPGHQAGGGNDGAPRASLAQGLGVLAGAVQQVDPAKERGGYGASIQMTAMGSETMSMSTGIAGLQADWAHVQARHADMQQQQQRQWQQYEQQRMQLMSTIMRQQQQQQQQAHRSDSFRMTGIYSQGAAPGIHSQGATPYSIGQIRIPQLAAPQLFAGARFGLQQAAGGHSAMSTVSTHTTHGGTPRDSTQAQQACTHQKYDHPQPWATSGAVSASLGAPQLQSQSSSSIASGTSTGMQCSSSEMASHFAQQKAHHAQVGMLTQAMISQQIRDGMQLDRNHAKSQTGSAWPPQRPLD